MKKIFFLIPVVILLACRDNRNGSKTIGKLALTAADSGRNNLVFSSGFESPDPFSIWPTVVGRITQSKDVAREGNYSARIEVVKGDAMIAQGARSELNLNKIPSVPAEQWFGMSYYIPVSFTPDLDKITDILAQWHSAFGHPPVAFGINVNSWYVEFSTGRQGLIPLGEVSKGVWTDVVFHIKWSYDEDGLTEIWINGIKKLSVPGPNFYHEKPGPFFKCGDYKWPWNTGVGEGATTITTNRLIYLDAVRVGNEKATYKDVSPGSLSQESVAGSRE